ncbi:MAG: hypothetical protein AAF483_13405 [Planctomycetota bacterium]
MATVVQEQEEKISTKENPSKKNKPKRPPGKKPLKKVIVKETMMMIRRIHLYSGLFMFPWVLLYGFTGWFFNHPSYFSGDEIQSFRSSEVAEGALAELPDPQILAEQVVQEINQDSETTGGPKIELTNRRNPYFDRYLFFSVRTEDQSHRIEIHPVTGDGTIRTTMIDPEEDDESDSEDESKRNPLVDVDKIEVEDNTYSIANEQIPRLLTDLGLSSGEPSAGRSSPSLIFFADIDGIPCKVSYSTGSGSINALADEAPRSEMSAKSFSQRLHLSRGYAPSAGTRTWWAISVDAMFLSMVFWGISGIFMWWQLKRTRKIGFAVLAASALCATWLVFGMHDELTSRVRGRSSRSSASSRPATTATTDPKTSAAKNSANSDASKSDQVKEAEKNPPKKEPNAGENDTQQSSDSSKAE